MLLLQLQHLSCALFPQPEHIAAARAEHPLHGGMVALQQRFRHIGLNGARKAAALRPAKTGLLQNLFGRNKK